jgi:hypothetical protein
VANPERMPRRIIRLLHQVRRIEWDECPTEEAARQREELLICVLAPKFNAVGKVWERTKRMNGNPLHDFIASRSVLRSRKPPLS